MFTHVVLGLNLFAKPKNLRYNTLVTIKCQLKDKQASLTLKCNSHQLQTVLLNKYDK